MRYRRTQRLSRRTTEREYRNGMTHALSPRMETHHDAHARVVCVGPGIERVAQQVRVPIPRRPNGAGISHKQRNLRGEAATVWRPRDNSSQGRRGGMRRVEIESRSRYRQLRHRTLTGA